MDYKNIVLISIFSNSLKWLTELIVAYIQNSDIRLSFRGNDNCRNFQAKVSSLVIAARYLLVDRIFLYQVHAKNFLKKFKFF